MQTTVRKCGILRLSKQPSSGLKRVWVLGSTQNVEESSWRKDAYLLHLTYYIWALRHVFMMWFLLSWYESRELEQFEDAHDMELNVIGIHENTNFSVLSDVEVQKGINWRQFFLFGFINNVVCGIMVRFACIAIFHFPNVYGYWVAAYVLSGFISAFIFAPT
eukprot:UN05759